MIHVVYWLSIVVVIFFLLFIPILWFVTLPTSQEPKLAKKPKYNPVAEMRAARELWESANRADMVEWERQFARATGKPLLIDNQVQYVVDERNYATRQPAMNMDLFFNLKEIDRMQKKSRPEDDFDRAWNTYVSKQTSRQEDDYDKNFQTTYSTFMDEEYRRKQSVREELIESAPKMILPENDDMDGSPLRTDIDGSYVVISDKKVVGAWRKPAHGYSGFYSG